MLRPAAGQKDARSPRGGSTVPTTRAAYPTLLHGFARGLTLTADLLGRATNALRAVAANGAFDFADRSLVLGDFALGRLGGWGGCRRVLNGRRRPSGRRPAGRRFGPRQGRRDTGRKDCNEQHGRTHEGHRRDEGDERLTIRRFRVACRMPKVSVGPCASMRIPPVRYGCRSGMHSRCEHGTSTPAHARRAGAHFPFDVSNRTSRTGGRSAAHSP